MPYADFIAHPGTIKDPQHTKSSEARWNDTDKVHFPDGYLTPIPSFEESVFNTGNVQALSGTCRSQWSSKLTGTGSPYSFYGTHSGLYVEYRGALYNITPLAGQRSYDLGTDPLSVHSGDATMTITIPSHGLSVGDHITLAFATDVDSVDADTYINIEHHVDTVPDADTVTVELGTTASNTDTGGGSLIVAYTLEAAASLTNPLNTTNTSNVITVDYTAHGLATGDRIKLSDCSTIGGIPANEINAEHIVTVVDVDSFTITVSTDATSTVSSGGGTDIHIFKQIAAGNQNQEIGSGLGFGIFGYGILGAPFISTDEQLYPRIWSFDNLGNDIVTCPGDYLAGDGQKIYIWSGDTDVAPTVLTNAPTNCNWVAVINNAVVALCDDTVRISEIGNGTVWSGITTSTFDVQRAYRLLSTHSVGEKSAIIFTPEPLYLSYVGGEWDLVELAADYPIVSPLGAARFQGGLLWMDTSARLCFFNGANVSVIVNDQNGEYIRQNLSDDSAYTSFAFSDPKHNQVWFFWPATGETNPTDYVIFNPDSKSFTLGKMDRTSAQRPGAIDASFYMTDDSDTYAHFTGATTNFNWYGESAYFFTGDGSRRVRINNVISNVTGAATLTLKGLEYPQGTPVTYTSVTLAGNMLTVRAAGRLLSARLSGSTDFTLRGLKLNLEAQGGRI